ncbi:N-6 DNA methylase [Prosthecobacter sp.]|uniref:HsdM family class I SAM-dependent methyltransferase n=1 Tax=Prosthecobacter sp. TaxID=1965333 RepID=UPI0024892748|nr:N-6 DNA methylase [Prosthecobacter sp.]MDI1313812.1 N-6 DNA methylase [Prosthecobacter sp.]
MPALRRVNKTAAELPNYGIDSRSKGVRWFGDKATPELIDYLDLIEPQGPLAARLIKPDGVVENQERPLLFFVNEGRLATVPKEKEQQLQDLRRSLACRGDRAYLAIIRPGTLEVIPVSLKDRTAEWKLYTAGTTEALTFFSRLALGRCEEMPSGGEVDYLFKEIFTLVDGVATKLAGLHIERADIISLVGRVLFFRFLRDRGIIKEEEDTKKIAPKATALDDCFANAANTAATCRWLDKTFNGDFLALTDNGNLEFFEAKGTSTGKKLFHHLTQMLRGEEATAGEAYQGRFNFVSAKFSWGHLDFAHIPIGLLSQVYEKLSWKWDHAQSKETSVHYTPRNIAATLVGEAFDGLPNAHAARVLDPACGASIFLVIAFRHLYRELWKHKGQRPDTDAIRSILENQLVGFDISDSALKLSALSLYLTAIELDPDPAPPEKLQFKALRKGHSAMLFDWRKEDDKEKGPVIGSIGKHVGKRFDRSFHLVLCNPPWTNIGSDYSDLSAELDQVSREIVTSLDVEIGTTYQNPDSVPDLPFIWRSMQWCKADGRIAMALPARTLFKQGPMAVATRKALFSLLEVSGIINGSNLRDSKVWPEMDQSFMLLFARNRRPKPHHRIHFITPHTDLKANALGEMRIDSKSAQLVDVEQTMEEPWLWKALAIGTALDVEVVRKIKAVDCKTLGDYWKKELGLACCNGYQIKEEQEEQKDATKLHKLPDLNSTDAFRFKVAVSELDLFKWPTLFRTRIRDKKPDPLMVYRGPLALIKESPGPDRELGWALVCDSDLAYNESFHGYSASSHPSGPLLVRYLQLFVHSKLWPYYALLTSGKFGFERPTIDKADLDKCPFFPFEKLDDPQRNEVKALSKRLINEDATVFPDIDTFFGKLYGLSPSDIEVIADTLRTCDPYDRVGERASEMPTAAERKAFLRRVESHVRPLFKVLGKLPEIAVWKPSEKVEHSFVFFTLTAKGAPMPEPDELFLGELRKLADETGTTRIIHEVEGGLVIGILRQYRYWTPSRARLLGGEIMRNHLSVFED